MWRATSLLPDSVRWLFVAIMSGENRRLQNSHPQLCRFFTAMPLLCLKITVAKRLAVLPSNAIPLMIRIRARECSEVDADKASKGGFLEIVR
jgi:hypothetical protein